MAIPARKRLTSVVTGPRRTPGEKLELIANLITGYEKTTPSMLRIKILAICEGRTIPKDRKNFLVLAQRAGVGQARAYAAWQEFGTENAPEPRHAPAAVTALLRLDREPVSAALYRYYDEADLLLYIGISDTLPDRVSSHSKGSSWMGFAARSTIHRYPSHGEAAAAEVEAIKTEHPLFNHQHNNTPEARRRLVEYLIERDRLDLLAPAVSRG